METTKLKVLYYNYYKKTIIVSTKKDFKFPSKKATSFLDYCINSDRGLAKISNVSLYEITEEYNYYVLHFELIESHGIFIPLTFERIEYAENEGFVDFDDFFSILNYDCED